MKKKGGCERGCGEISFMSELKNGTKDIGRGIPGPENKQLLRTFTLKLF